MLHRRVKLNRLPWLAHTVKSAALVDDDTVTVNDVGTDGCMKDT